MFDQFNSMVLNMMFLLFTLVNVKMIVTVLVGGFSKTIEVFELQLKTDIKSTTMVHKGSVQCDENPAFLEVVDNHVYAVHEVNFKERSGQRCY